MLYFWKELVETLPGNVVPIHFAMQYCPEARSVRIG